MTDEGRARIWDVVLGEWRLAWPVDAREALDFGSALLEEPKMPPKSAPKPPKPAPVAPAAEKPASI